MESGFVDKRDKLFQSLYARNFVHFFPTEFIDLNNSYYKYYICYSAIYNSTISINSVLMKRILDVTYFS